MSAIRFVDVIKRFPRAPRPAVDGVSLDVAEAELVVLVGPSGCGKTTLLKMVNRLIEPTSGRIEVDGDDIRSVNGNALRRRMGYVIQQVGLFPHLRVAANVGTVPRLLGWPRKRIQERVEELLDLVGLEPAVYARRYPFELSGGQQQRVGLARALAADPEILLMDEPFGAIDAITRTHLQAQLGEIQRRVRKTILFVTHDVEEALRLGDRLVVMRDGQIVQSGTPVDVVSRPADEFVRELLDTDDVFRSLSLMTVASAMTGDVTTTAGSQVRTTENLRAALSLLVGSSTERLAVIGEDGNRIGALSLDDIRRCVPDGHQEQPVLQAGVSR